MQKILIIDDEKDVLKGLKDFLVSEHFDVATALTGRDGIQKAFQEKPDLVLLDLRLPDIDGYDVCRELRSDERTKSTPILMVSTRSKDMEKVIGLEVGADDYITKPYSPIELLARIRVALRRVNKQEPGAAKSQSYRSKNLSVDADSRQVHVDKTSIKLTKKEFDLLLFFLMKPAKVHTRNNLMSAVWGVEYESMQGTVDSHIKTLRQKLGKAGQFIETVPAVGYRWTEEVV